MRLGCQRVDHPWPWWIGSEQYLTARVVLGVYSDGADNHARKRWRKKMTIRGTVDERGRGDVLMRDRVIKVLMLMLMLKRK